MLGIWMDREHRKNLEYRRAQVGHVLVSDLRSLPGMDVTRMPTIVCGEIVLSTNRLLTALGRIKQLFGGEVKSFHGLVTRGRQEAVIRLMEQAAHAGYDAVGNVRVEPIDLAVPINGRQRNKGLYIGILAYGTAYCRTAGVFPPPAPPDLMEFPQ